MIIGNNNNNNFNSNFNERFNYIKEQNKKNQNPIKLVPNDPTRHYDVTNRNDMTDKSLLMLQERLNNGLISLEEFNEKVRKINQSR